MAEIVKDTKAEIIPQAPSAMTPTEYLIERAFEKGMDASQLYKLLARERDDKRRMALNEAFARFKAECPLIVGRSVHSHFKRKVVQRDGSIRTVDVRYPRIEDIQEVADPILAKCGLSYSWDDEVLYDKKIARTTFWLRHDLGGEKAAHGESPIVEIRSREGKSVQTPGMAVNAALTYARRAAMISGLAVRVNDFEPDESGIVDDPISDDSLMTLMDAVEKRSKQTGITLDSMTAKVTKVYGVKTLKDLTEDAAASAIARLAKAIEAAERKGKP